MPRVEIPLIGPSYTNREKPLSAQKAVNMWPEINPEARNQVALHNTAGLRTFATLSGKDRGMHEFNNLMYAVSGTTLYSIDETGANTALGTIAGEDRCVMANDSYQLIIVTGGPAYKYTVAGGVEAITDPEVVNPTTVAYLNNQFIMDRNDGVWGEFVTSSVDPEFSVDALDFAQAESHPDDIIAIVAFRQLVYFYGSHSVEPWQNTGSGNPPFARVNSGVQPYGLAGLHAITKTDEFMYFLDTKRIPRRSNGLNFLNIGNPALGVEFAKYTKISDCIAYDFVQDNQQFVAFTFPTADKTWCFHEPSGSWFELSYIKTGTLDSANPASPETDPETPVDAPAYIGPDISNVSYDSGSAMAPIDAGALFTGDDIVYSLTGGSWPVGISIDAVTGIISGTPTGGAQVHTGLIVTATNAGGTADATAFQFTVTAPAWEYADLATAEASGDAWVNGDDITITGGAVFLYISNLEADGYSGLVHKEPYGSGNGTLSASTLIDSTAANSDPDTWGWTDGSVGVKTTDYDLDTNGGLSRMRDLTIAGRVILSSAATMGASDTEVMRIYDDITCTTTSSSAGFQIEQSQLFAYDDGVNRELINLWADSSDTDWSVQDATVHTLGKSRTSASRIFMYMKQGSYTVWFDDDATPTYSGTPRSLADPGGAAIATSIVGNTTASTGATDTQHGAQIIARMTTA